jgi:hypothetical protein
MFIVNDIPFLRLLWAHLRLRIGFTIEVVMKILVRPSREWKLFVPRPPPIIMIDEYDPLTGGPIGAAYAGGNPMP